MGKYDFLLFPIAIGVMWTLFSVFVEKGMKFFGITRGNTSWLVINVFFFTVLNQLADFNSMFTLLLDSCENMLNLC